jgi:hypothetical protein
MLNFKTIFNLNIYNINTVNVTQKQPSLCRNSRTYVAHKHRLLDSANSDKSTALHFYLFLFHGVSTVENFVLHI